MPSPEYLETLQEAILAVHGCESRHLGSAFVKETFEGQTAFEGQVETFDLLNHPQAEKCYAWAWNDNGTMRTTAVLGVPPIDSPGTAVTVAILAKAKLHA